VSLARRRIAPAVAVLTAVLGSQRLSNLIKDVADRARPSVTYADAHPLVPLPDTSSMPSGHAWIAAAAATCCGWGDPPAASGSWAWPR
jgi:membrane-associated phospholipid phosphatase